MLPAVHAWQALHVYTTGQFITAMFDQGDGPVLTLFQCLENGTSGATEPTWQLNPDPTPDGSTSWDDITIIDTTCQAHIYALSSTP